MAAFAAADGRIVYATNGTAGDARVTSPSALGESLHGVVASELVKDEVDGREARVFRAYAPFRLADGSMGAIVLDKDYFSVPDEDIWKIQSLLTVVDGRITYGAGEYAGLD